jgi:nucleoid-associated protein YgaU
VTREHKLALIVGFALILVVGVFVSDHFSKARLAKPEDRLATSAGMPKAGQVPPVAYPAAQVSDPVAVAPSPAPQHTPGEFAMHADRPRLESPLAGDVGNATRGPGLNGGGGDVKLNSPGPGHVVAANVVDVPGEGSVPVGRNTPRPGDGASRGAGAPTPALPVSSGQLRQHTVAKGDTLAKIATKYYGEGRLYKQLAQYNGSKVGSDSGVNLGTTLQIPPRDVLLGQAVLAPEGTRPPAPATTVPTVKADPKGGPAGPAKPDTKIAGGTRPDVKKPDAPAPAPDRSYTVKPGDTLQLIALRELGTGKRWREIQKLNVGTLGDDDTIGVGMVLKLPGKTQ